MFEKASRKLEETAFFVRELGDQQDLDAVEFRFNALLSAGKSVVNSLKAQIQYREAQILQPTPQALTTPQAATLLSKATKREATERMRRAYRSHFEAWSRTRTPEEVDLFDVLQELRNIEVHKKDSASLHTPKLEERRQPRPLPTDPTYVAVFANYMAMGMLSHDVTIGVTTYTFQVDPGAPSEAANRVLFQRFAKTKEKPTLEIGQAYASLLNSLVDYFLAHYT